MIADDRPTCFVADIASNHDGELERARDLIWMASRAGANAVKFQHFRATKIVSDYGFRHLGHAVGHQRDWTKPVFETYRRYELNREWTEDLLATAQEAQVALLTTPYDSAAVEEVGAWVSAFKIGSGDIDWLTFIRCVAAQGKPMLLASGAANFTEVIRAVETILEVNPALALMQCNTNYTGSTDNFRFINLRVLETFSARWPGMPLGISDHTPGHATVLGAVAMGARVVEKHFTDDNHRTGPDHAFAMDPTSWSEMVLRTRELECSLGDGIKRVEENERDASVIQRRCIRLSRSVPAGVPLSSDDLTCLRPASLGALAPDRLASIVGSLPVRDMLEGEAICSEDLVRPC